MAPDTAALILEGAAAGEDRHTPIACTKRCPQNGASKGFCQWQIRVNGMPMQSPARNSGACLSLSGDPDGFKLWVLLQPAVDQVSRKGAKQ
jgi:hypothetical protein